MELDLMESRELIKIATQLPPNQYNPLRELFFPVAKDRPSFSTVIDYEVKTMNNDVSTLQARNGKAKVVGKKDSKIISLTPPTIREKQEATPRFLRGFSASTIYNKTPEEILQMRDDAIFEMIRDLKTRAENRIGVMACQLIETGKIQYTENVLADGSGGFDFQIDLAWPIELLPALGAGLRWNEANAAISANLETWSQIMAKYSSAPNAILMGANAYNSFANNAKVQGDYDRLNFRVGSLSPASDKILQGTYQNFEVYKAPAFQYKAENGTMKYLYNPNKVTLFNKEVVQQYNEILFGLIEEVNSDAVGEMYFSKQWEEQDPSTIWTLLACAPIPVLPIEGSVLTATVQV